MKILCLISEIPKNRKSFGLRASNSRGKKKKKKCDIIISTSFLQFQGQIINICDIHGVMTRKLKADNNLKDKVGKNI